MLKNSVNSRPRFVIRGSSTQTAAVPMARRSIIPAGRYTSVVANIVPTRTNAGANAIEVTYDLTDARGKLTKMREIIPEESFPYTRFSDAMISAGLPNGGNIFDAVGVEERITVEYPNPHGLGRITKRTPLKSTSTKAAANDDAESTETARYAADEEFDDFLLDDEDEED